MFKVSWKNHKKYTRLIIKNVVYHDQKLLFLQFFPDYLKADSYHALNSDCIYISTKTLHISESTLYGK